MILTEKTIILFVKTNFLIRSHFILQRIFIYSLGAHLLTLWALWFLWSFWNCGNRQRSSSSPLSVFGSGARVTWQLVLEVTLGEISSRLVFGANPSNFEAGWSLPFEAKWTINQTQFKNKSRLSVLCKLRLAPGSLFWVVNSFLTVWYRDVNQHRNLQPLLNLIWQAYAEIQKCPTSW